MENHNLSLLYKEETAPAKVARLVIFTNRFCAMDFVILFPEISKFVMSQIASALLYYFADAIVRFSQSSYTFDENGNPVSVDIEIDRDLETTATVT